MELNRIYHGDNMYFMPDMPDECIDLIYIDPPFGTQSLWKSKAFKEKVQELQFYDVFGGGVNGYVNFLTERLREMHRLLKPTGSLFVHLDWRMAHYIKIELDKIFGVKNPASPNTNFVNEIIWCYKDVGGGRNTNYYKRKHDTILWYSKTKSYKTNKIARDILSETTLDRFSSVFNDKGEITYRNLKEKRPKEFQSRKKQGRVPEDLDQVFISKFHGRQLEDYWTDIKPIRKRRSGDSCKEDFLYPTQKPLKLLQRLIETTTKENDVVSDFFCGCGTAIVAAQRLNRQWIGMDASKTACEVMLKRIKEDQPLFNYGIVSKPMTGAEFNKLKPLEFEKAAVRYIGGVTNHSQVADGGIDGRLAFDGTPIQVKKFDKPIGDNDMFRGFYYPLKQHGRGVYISWKGYTKPAKQIANKWRSEGLDIQLLTIKDILTGKFREQPLKRSF